MTTIEMFSVEDGINVHAILLHHLGNPRAVDDDGKALAVVDEATYTALERDLLRYCTRLRCAPRTGEHIDALGYHVPKHQLIGKQWNRP